MADRVWKGVSPLVVGHSKQLSLNKFFDPSIPSMRKGHDIEKRGGGNRKRRKRLIIKVATTSLPAVDCQKADRWNAASSCQKHQK